MFKKIVKSNKYLFSLALAIKEKKLKKNSYIGLNKDESKLVENLKTDGVAVIPNFFTADECTQMIDAFEALDEKYAKYYNNDKRIYGIEKLSAVFKNKFHDNEMFKKIGEAYIGDKLILQTTMAAKIVPDDTAVFGSGGAWHRDSFSRQFKAIAYLDDVNINNGPFMYIKGSHTMENINKVLFQLKGHTPPSNFRYTDDEIERISTILGQEVTYYTAPKGSLVLADIRGIHTGMPIKEGHRYAVFNYYIAESFHQANNHIEQLGKY